MESEREFYARRAGEEERAARQASSAKVRQTHQALAAAYAGKARRDAVKN